MKKNLKVIIILLIIICFFTALFFQLIKYDSVKEAFILATTAKPQVFTELYFENHLSLPDKITLSKENKFKFTIHNLEKKDMEYQYEVYIDTDSEKQIIETGSVLIKDNGFKTIYINFTIETSLQRSRVVVNIINKNQQIFFWIE